jgi:ABC-type amino acid transport system permease subunit
VGPPLPAALKDTQLHYHWDLAMVLADTDRWWHGIGITLLYSVATVAGGIVIGVFCGLTLLGQKAMAHPAA